ncbi:exopolysaccharide biosynthesis protein [Paradevosia shaoguanensis]|uniref:exopolysaccharide biosynthesis protein n=1 Tax=Paradevosia shaoguanensis TaxID=1335043 RepID=UPI000455BB98|nr:exopolysaccharide biosynthesis protein [Paradevosia shaoguanensis]CDP54200.1 exopolysaccharide synthesis protein ExoD-related p rotein [Devosia sp. DBB001]
MSEEASTPVSPIERYMARMVAALQRLARSDDPNLTFSRLIDVMGRGSHRLLILVFTLLNMVPGPPGFGGTIAWTTLGIALAMIMRWPIRLPALIGDRGLPLNLLLKLSERVAVAARYAARFSRPRLRWLTGAAATIPYGVFVIVVSLVMTIPIPFINAIPNVGLCVLSFSMLNRDGLGAIVGVAISLLGLGIAAAAIFGAYELGMAALGIVT